MATAEATSARLASLLIEFGSAPGNFPVRLRQPSELYDQLDTVASWALGRLPPNLVDQADPIRAAAILFIQRACFALGNNHYEVLGFCVGKLEPEALRCRYRALIRLTHPDMGVTGLPTTAAGTVNRAYEVLSDSELRARYDGKLSEREGSYSSRGEHAFDRIDLRASFGERWQSLMARYPVLMRTGLTIVAVFTLGTALLTWVAIGSNGGSSMIVARAPSAGDENELDSSLQADRLESRIGDGSLGVTPASSKSSGGRAAIASTREATIIITAPSRGLTGASGTPVAASSNPSVAASTVASSAPTTATPLKSFGNIFGRIEQPPPEAESTLSTGSSSPAAAPRQHLASSNAAALVQVPTPAPVATSRSGPSTAPTIAPSTVPTAQPVLARNNGAGGTGSVASSATFPVDAARAKTYLTDILMSLERPSSARSTNAYLSEMNVQGSLLQPALQLMRKYPEVNIENMNWQDNLRPGVMKVQGVVVMTARSANSAEARKVAFQLNAEFWGLRDGTFLASLNMKEED